MEWTQVTGSEWETPSVVQNYHFAIGKNTYVCYGNYVGEIDIGNGDMLSKYQFTGWDILYPVKRDGIIYYITPTVKR